MEHFDDVGWRRDVDNRRGDKLIHGLVVGGTGRIMDQSCSTDIDGTRDESHANTLLLRNSLQSSNEIGPLKVLQRVLIKARKKKIDIQIVP